MISVEEAKRILMERVRPVQLEEVPLPEALGRYVGEDVVSAHHHPLFDCSAIDGYAFRFDAAITEWRVVGEVAAGDVFAGHLRKGECVRIFTGGMVPADADACVMQEFVQRDGDRMRHTDTRLKAGGNVRFKGEQLKPGDVLLRKGERIDAVTIGLLASAGIATLRCARAIATTVITTGGEFAEASVSIDLDGDRGGLSTPAPGRIFNSNGAMLAAALQHCAVNNTTASSPDELAALKWHFHWAWNAMRDVVILTGGVSVGDHDLVELAAQEMGATIHFHGVAQKPGKPMLFAELDGSFIFGLPGNPRAAMILFWEYVLPFLRAMQGASEPWPSADVLPLAHTVALKGDRAEFRAASLKGGKVTLLADEGSHMLKSMVDADALAYLPNTQRVWSEGDTIEVHYLPR